MVDLKHMIINIVPLKIVWFIDFYLFYDLLM